MAGGDLHTLFYILPVSAHTFRFTIASRASPSVCLNSSLDFVPCDAMDKQQVWIVF